LRRSTRIHAIPSSISPMVALAFPAWAAAPVAVLMGWAVLGETPTLLCLGGGALVVGGVAMVQRLGRAR
jgi:drug/metabolite transporter (DMT)-like permease